MSTTSLVLLYTLIALCVAYFLARVGRSARLYFRFHGKRLVTCPETNQPAAVEVDTKLTFTEAVTRAHPLRLSECSRWPGRQDCGQQCLNQIESTPEDCLVRNIVSKWYAGRTCVYCRKPITEINWLDQRPALLDPERKTIQWDQIPAERLPEVFSTHAPVCWNCHIAQTFRREHQDLVVERPWRWRS